MASTWEFIVVGGGPAGCALASSLCRSPKRPQVLLIEAGSRPDDKLLKVNGQRWGTYRNATINWGYKTTPQEHCNGRQIDYSRGKMLGGSTAINFCIYAIGPRDDYNQWADVVDDDNFQWDRIHARFKKLETFDGTISDPAHAKYAAPRAEDHGANGPLHVGYAPEWEQDLPLLMDSFMEAGLPHSPDNNSGDPIGLTLAINTAHKGVRVTAADLLEGAPDNLTTVTEAPVQRVLLQGKKAVGVESWGRQFMASKEVILSAGALDTPKVLMHSGIGPAQQLQQFHIPVNHHLPAVGQGLRDHVCVSLTFQRNPSTNDRNTFFRDPAAMESAMEEWKATGSGPWARYSCQLGIGWFKSERIESMPESKALPASVQEFLRRPNIPHYELITNFPLHIFLPGAVSDYSYTCMSGILMNPQSYGEVRLQSSNPDDPLLFDPRFLSHPYDRAACVMILRHLLDVCKHPAFQKDTVATLNAPPSESDEDLLEYWRLNLFSVFHMSGTVKMGREGDADKDAAVDSRFRVFGIEGLRVADMSVVPVITNNHTQATAYVTGVTCAEVLKTEYGL